MAKLINCECGRKIRGETDDDVVREAQKHIEESHPELVASVTREQLLDWVQED